MLPIQRKTLCLICLTTVCIYYTKKQTNRVKIREDEMYITLNPRRTCALLCVSGCLLPRFMPPRATTPPKSDVTHSALHWLKFRFGDFKKHCVQKLQHE